jgi:hypothetical protein
MANYCINLLANMIIYSFELHCLLFGQLLVVANLCCQHSKELQHNHHNMAPLKMATHSSRTLPKHREHQHTHYTRDKQ